MSRPHPVCECVCVSVCVSSLHVTGSIPVCVRGPRHALLPTGAPRLVCLTRFVCRVEKFRGPLAGSDNVPCPVEGRVPPCLPFADMRSADAQWHADTHKRRRVDGPSCRPPLALDMRVYVEVEVQDVLGLRDVAPPPALPGLCECPCGSGPWSPTGLVDVVSVGALVASPTHPLQLSVGVRRVVGGTSVALMLTGRGDGSGTGNSGFPLWAACVSPGQRLHLCGCVPLGGGAAVVPVPSHSRGLCVSAPAPPTLPCSLVCGPLVCGEPEEVLPVRHVAGPCACPVLSVRVRGLSMLFLCCSFGASVGLLLLCVFV